MNRLFSQIFSVFCILIFINPLVVDQIHKLHHTDEVCTEQATNHLHELEHDCDFCDHVPSNYEHSQFFSDISSAFCFAGDLTITFLDESYDPSIEANQQRGPPFLI